MEGYRRILERCARGNPPELQAKLNAGHEQFLAMVRERQQAKAQETRYAGDSRGHQRRADRSSPGLRTTFCSVTGIAMINERFAADVALPKLTPWFERNIDVKPIDVELDDEPGAASASTTPLRSSSPAWLPCVGLVEIGRVAAVAA